jgi:hypothetical protein
MASKQFTVIRETTVIEVTTFELDIPDYVLSGVVWNDLAKEYAKTNHDALAWKKTDESVSIVGVTYTIPGQTEESQNVFLAPFTIVGR